MEAQKKAQGVMEKAMRWLDSFHNVEPQRAPSSIGCALTVLMFPVVLVYVIVWVVNYQNQPPVETLVIDWSVAKGPFPMKVQCAEANCWMWLSGCNSDASGQCIALTSGQEHTLQMCYSWRAREGLHMWWKSANGTDPSTAGIKIFSDAPSGQVNQLVESGRSSMTYVKTHDLTQEEGSYNYLRREWFVMYLSPQALEPTHQGCQNEAPADAQTAQVVMRPEFYERKVEKTDLWVSVIGEAGGAFGLAQTAFFGLYLLLWYTQYGAQRLEEKVHNHTHSAQADLEAAKSAAPQPRMAGAESKLSEDEAFALGVERADI